MIREALSNYPHALLTAVGLILFLGVFVGMLIWVFRKGGKEFYGRMAELPFNERPTQ